MVKDIKRNRLLFELDTQLGVLYRKEYNNLGISCYFKNANEPSYIHITHNEKIIRVKYTITSVNLPLDVLLKHILIFTGHHNYTIEWM